jgi:cholesterol oxidase
LKLQPIARPLHEIGARYTAVVVGSGYGAGVAAARLARAGQSVCVLERGREILPGQFADGLASAGADMQVDTARGRLGAADGLFNLHLNDDMLAMVGCGLGGTSLINANVALEVDPRHFATAAWPQAFRDDPTLLAPYVERARQVLAPTPYPEHFPKLNKLEALRKSAQVLGQPFSRPPITVNFEDQTNPFGVPQPACTLCGDCTSGCNVGAKNTTRMNYLPDAHAHGAQIFTGARVRHVAREGSGWRVFFEAVALRGTTVPNDGQAAPDSVYADLVVLGAGALGSTEILLRSREHGLALSGRLGRRFSGNGDVLALGHNADWDPQPANGNQDLRRNINGVGIGSNDVPKDQWPGPCITGLIDMRATPQLAEGLVIEEGVLPGALATLLTPALFFNEALYGGEFTFGASQVKTRLLDAQDMAAAVQHPTQLAATAYTGSVARTQTYLVMSVDESAGELRLQNDRLRIHWPGVGGSPVIARDNEWLKLASQAISGQFVANPLWSAALGKKLITVHPLGGCGMGDDATQGVVDHLGQVFSDTTGTAVHAGLWVCDGAVLPGAVGVNPLLTITALAERAMQHLCDARGWHSDPALASRGPLPVQAPAPSKHRHWWQRALDVVEDGLLDAAKKAVLDLIARDPAKLAPHFEFTETMSGWISTQAITPRAMPEQRMASDYALAAAWGRAAGQSMAFELTIHTDDLSRLLDDPTHPAQIRGSVSCPALDATPMQVDSGVFHLFPVDPQRVETWTMGYEMVLLRANGSRLRFKGHKVLHQKAGSSPWTDTTTLMVKVYDLDSATMPLVAQGLLSLGLEDLAWQAASIRLTPPSHWIGQLEHAVPRARDAISQVYLGQFAGFFGTTLMRAYGGLLADLNNFPAQDAPALARRMLRAPQPEVLHVPVGDPARGFQIRLTRYRGGARGPVVLAPGFSVRASSFATDTVDRNLVETLCASGYDCWLFDYRASPDSDSPIAPFTIDDIVREDWPAAIRTIRQVTGAPSVQAMAHCVGSMSLLMALLDGMDGVRSVIASQLTLHPVTSWLNAAKADIGLARLLEGYAPLHGRFDCVPGTTDLDRTIDTLAYQLPVPDGEACKNPLCRRVFALFGPSWAHGQLNHATHTALGGMFGSVALHPFEQLSLIMQRGKAVDADGNDCYATADRAPRLALPISFLVGADNQLFFPETSLRTQAWLQRHNDPALYRRQVFEGYAHMDLFIGRAAAKEVYPWIIAELDRFN